jgi:DNA helicase-2/ATP-dependent DNA helicase PcrA
VPDVVPLLEGDAAAAVAHRGSHLQIIACAGSGKTEVVSQRVAALLADGEPATSIVAFTFTERAAAELKDRIAARVRTLIGPDAVDILGGLFVGTIHAYCFRLLQTYVPRYETFDVLDTNQLTAFLMRESNRLQLKSLRDDGRPFVAVNDFIESANVVENELIDQGELADPFRSVYASYLETLDRYRLLTFGLQIERAVAELHKPDVATRVHADLRHLIVDEYQDVNPAQEALIRLLAAEGSGVLLCVVGDDDQAIYQWRGSSVGNIVTFTDRYPDVATFELLVNRRCREGIVTVANAFAQTIPGRLDKEMQGHRSDDGIRVVDLTVSATEAGEAAEIAQAIVDLHRGGLAYRDIAVLARKKVAFSALLDAFEQLSIPVQPGGRTGLFTQPEADALGQLFAWLVDEDWTQGRGAGRISVDRAGLLSRFRDVFSLKPKQLSLLGDLVDGWKAVVPVEKSVDLIGLYYDLLRALSVDSWDLSDPYTANRVGTLARFSATLADYETVRRRARPDAQDPSAQVGGEFGGIWYFRNLSRYLNNFAYGGYEGFEGEPEIDVDAVDLLTVHGAKGLEWPVVFIPSLTVGRFAGGAPKPKKTLVPDHLYDAVRYGGGDADERRLFYVAMTRARDWVSFSRHERVKKQSSRPSPYFTFVQGMVSGSQQVPLLVGANAADEDAPVRLTYSDLAAFLSCGYSYRLRSRLGFMPSLAPELGYGKAVHHVMRAAAEFTMGRGRVPGTSDVEQILAQDFYLPVANKAAHAQMKAAAMNLVMTYLDNPEYAAELQRTWATERPFELNLPGVVVAGRADVIFSQDDGEAPRLTLVDYKTATHGGSFDLQLQIYADAGRREGLNVDSAYVHDLKDASRAVVPVGPAEVIAAEATALGAAALLRAKEFEPTRDRSVCRGCDVRPLCRHRR